MFINKLLLLVLLINNFIIINGDTNFGINKNKNLTFRRANIFNERSCTCMTEVSCSCCEIAFMLFHMINRRCKSLIINHYNIIARIWKIL